jgi:phytoene dehydrogenase-like protein
MRAPAVVIVGAGLAGLCCARELHARSVPFVLLEAADQVGGRVRTDEHEGFRLDRGFQVLLTAYPECRRVLDYAALDLHPFLPGALVRRGERFHRLSDPWRRPLDSIATLFAPLGGLADKLRVARFRAAVRGMSLQQIFERPERSSREALKLRGFSDDFVESFFRPFFGGVFLERGLETSSRMLEFLFKMFSEGSAALPAGGMQAIPRQIAAALPAESLRTGARVESIEPGRVLLSGGESIAARAVVVATDGAEASRLVPRMAAPAFRRTVCLYYDAPVPPVRRAVLVLNGNGESDGPVNHLAVVSQVAPGHAPAGRALVAANVVEPRSAEPADELEPPVRRQLTAWFGSAVDAWRHLRSYTIPRALPALSPGAGREPSPGKDCPEGVFVCGDHTESGSIQGAMLSGSRAARTARDWCYDFV